MRPDWFQKEILSLGYRKGGGGMENLGREPVFFLETQGGNFNPEIPVLSRL